MEKEPKKRSFFERLTGSIRAEELEEEEEQERTERRPAHRGQKETAHWSEPENEEAELTVDVYQTPEEIIIQTMVAGVRPDDLELTITRSMVTIRGKREDVRTIDEGDYFAKELYWGGFSRTILLPEEVDPEEAEAIEKHGLLTIKLQKIDKEHRTSVKVKSM